jgi:hypothetical protein
MRCSACRDWRCAVTPAEIVRTAVEAIGAIISLADSLGQRDAVLAALDASLAAARARTDADLAAKHGRR